MGSSRMCRRGRTARRRPRGSIWRALPSDPPRITRRGAAARRGPRDRTTCGTHFGPAGSPPDLDHSPCATSSAGLAACRLGMSTPASSSYFREVCTNPFCLPPLRRSSYVTRTTERRLLLARSASVAGAARCDRAAPYLRFRNCPARRPHRLDRAVEGAAGAIARCTAALVA